MVQEEVKWNRFFFIIDSGVGQGEKIHRTTIGNTGVHDWDVIMIVETWLKKKKSEITKDIQDNLPNSY